MRNLFGLALVLVIGLGASCNRDEQSGTQLEFSPQRFTIAAGLNPILSHSFQLTDLPTEHARFASETGRAWSEWTRANPLRASLIINESGLTWAFAEEVVIYAYADDFRSKREIFYRDQIRPDQGPRLDFIPSGQDALDLFSGERVNLVVEFRRLYTSPPQSIPATLTWSLDAL